MRLWAALYGTIWLVLIEILLAMRPNPEPIVLYGHLLLGIGIVAITYSNARSLRETRVPGRIKRIAAATYKISVAMIVLGVLLWFHVGESWPILFGVTMYDGIHILHVVNALAIIAQLAAVAIAYDMWEEKEFVRETAPGEVPPPDRPVAPIAAP